jgi:hypothetical protein
LQKAGWSGNKISEGVIFFAPLQTGPEVSPILLQNENLLSFWGLLGPECDVDLPLSSTAEVKERVELHLY